MKKVLIITPQLNPSLTGGTKIDCFIIERLMRNNTIIVSVLSDEKLNYINKNSFLYNWKYMQRIVQFKHFDYIFINSRLYPRLFFVMFIIKCFCRHTQFILIHHHFNFMTQSGWLKTVHKILELYVIRKADRMIIVSPYIRDIYYKMGFKKQQMHYLEISFDHTNKTISNKQISCERKMLFVGTIERRKGVDAIIEAAYLLKKEDIIIKVDIIGNILYDEYYELLTEKIRSYDLIEQIHFRGRVSNSELNHFYSSAHSFLFPTRHEGYGMVLIEAMAYGLPVIAYNNSAIPYFIKEGVNGLLVKNNSIEDLSEKMKCLWTNDLLRCQLSIGALEYFNKTRTYDDWNQEIDNFITQLVDKKQIRI
jgi:glycosyltransferase involved in cell wall biosynthesis